MVENIHGGLKMEFPHYNYGFPAITKLTVGSHCMLLNPKQLLWSY